MGTKDARIDAYIKKAPEFAKPVLNHFRALVHKTIPEIEETIKWGCPNFQYHGGLCTMASFNDYCGIGFFKAKLMKELSKPNELTDGIAGNLGKIKTVNDLPTDKILEGYLKEAAAINENGIKAVPKKKLTATDIPEMPDSLKKAFTKNKKAQEIFEAFSPSHKREYINWIIDEKTDETKNKRIETTLEWLEEGKTRMWKYQKK